MSLCGLLGRHNIVRILSGPDFIIENPKSISNSEINKSYFEFTDVDLSIKLGTLIKTVHRQQFIHPAPARGPSRFNDEDLREKPQRAILSAKLRTKVCCCSNFFVEAVTGAFIRIPKIVHVIDRLCSDSAHCLPPRQIQRFKRNVAQVSTNDRTMATTLQRRLFMI